jgi:hypothetical protein
MQHGKMLGGVIMISAQRKHAITGITKDGKEA